MTNSLVDRWDRGCDSLPLLQEADQTITQLHAAVKTAQELAATRLMEIERLQMRLKRHEPVSLYNGHDIDWWKKEAERRAAALQKIVNEGDYTAPEGMKRIAQAALSGSNEPCERHRWKPGMWNVYYVRSDGQERPALSAETAEGAANALRQDAADLVRVIESEGASRDASSEQPLTHFAGIPIIEDPTMPPDQIELRNDGNCPTGDWPHNFATETTERMTKGRCIYCGAPEKRT